MLPARAARAGPFKLLTPQLFKEEEEREESESMLDDRDLPLRIEVLSCGECGSVSAVLATLGTPKSPQLSRTRRLRGRALN